MAAFTVVARCAHGHPLVIRNALVDAAGEPFPTLYWLTCPAHVKAVADVEVVLDRADVVAVDLRDVHQPDLAAFELDERSVRGGALDDALDDPADF